MGKSNATVYHNLSLMLEAGVPILRSLTTSMGGAKGPDRRAWQDVREAVREGQGLAQSMGAHPKVFGRLDVLMVEAGEVSGDLPGSLKRLGQWYSFRASIKKKLWSEMALPVLVLTAAAFIIPFPHWFMGNMSTLGYLWRVSVPLMVFFIPVIAIWGIVRYTPDTGLLRRMVDGVAMKIPLVGRAVRQLAMSRYLRAFHTLFKAGVEVISCARMSAEVAGNAVVSSWVAGAAESARQGHPLSEGFSREFPREYLEAWLIGEESGELANVTERLAGMAEEKALWTIEQIGKWLPKVIYAIISLWMIHNILTIALSIWG